jgi:hypothetical protein
VCVCVCVCVCVSMRLSPVAIKPFERQRPSIRWQAACVVCVCVFVCVCVVCPVGVGACLCVLRSPAARNCLRARSLHIIT